MKAIVHVAARARRDPAERRHASAGRQRRTRPAITRPRGPPPAPPRAAWPAARQNINLSSSAMAWILCHASL